MASDREFKQVTAFAYLSITITHCAIKVNGEWAVLIDTWRVARCHIGNQAPLPVWAGERPLALWAAAGQAVILTRPLLTSGSARLDIPRILLAPPLAAAVAIADMPPGFARHREAG